MLKSELHDPANIFLLECIRVQLAVVPVNQLANLLTMTNWGVIALQATHHQLGGLLYSLQRQKLLPEPPTELVEGWKAEATLQAMLQMSYQAEGERVLSGMQDNGWAPILLKGFAWLNELYSESSTRGISDMDILVRKQDMPAVKQYLYEQGFIQVIDDFYASKAAAYEQFLAEQSYEAAFKKEFAGVAVVLDVHWQLGAGWPGYEQLGLFRLDRIDWQEQTEPFSFHGCEVRRLNLNAHFFHLVCHFGLHHRFSGVKWLHELCLLLESYDRQLDWDWLGEAARQTGCSKLLGVTLRLAEEFIGSSHRLAGRWQDYWPQFLPGEFALYRRRLFQSGSQMAEAVCLSLLMERGWDRLRLIGYLLFDPRGVPQLRLSAASYSLSRRMLQPLYLLRYILSGPKKKG